MVTTYSYPEMTATVSGTSVAFRAAVKASVSTSVTNLAIGVRGPGNENLDLVDANGGGTVIIPAGSWALLDAESAVFTKPGTYTWGLVWRVGTTWYGNLDGGTNTFVIAGATAPTPPPVDPNAMPVGNVTSRGITWRQVAAEDFTRAVAPSAFPSTYKNLGHITSGKYRNDVTCTVANSVLNVHLSHAGSYDMGAWIALLADPSGTGAWAFKGNARFSFRIKSTGSGGPYGTAAMLSVNDNNNWTRDGEMDVWEGNAGGFANVNHHFPGHPMTGTATTPLASTTNFHTVTVEWIGGVRTTYYLDGVQVAEYTGSSAPSATAEFLAVIQSAASDGSDNGAPDNETADIYIDWMAAWQL
jgi:hypothetical protein